MKTIFHIYIWIWNFYFKVCRWIRTASATEHGFGKWKSFVEPQQQLLHGSATPDTTVSSIFAYEHTEPHGGSARGLKMDCNNPKAGRDRELRVFPNLVSLLLFAVRFEFPPLTGRWLRFSGRTFVSARFYEFHVNSSK